MYRAINNNNESNDWAELLDQWNVVDTEAETVFDCDISFLVPGKGWVGGNS